jgi:hypothetical protein
LAVEKGGDDPHEDMMALDVLSSVVPTEMVSAVVSKDTTREAWDVIRVMHVDDERVRAATAQNLLRHFENATFKEDENIEDFSMHLSGMLQELTTLDEAVEEPKVVGKFLRSVPQHYRQIVVAIQSLLDIDTLMLANVMGRLKVAGDELEAPPPTVNHASKLYLSEEAWEEKWKARDSKKSSDGGPGGRGGRGRGRRSNRGHDRGGGHD